MANTNNTKPAENNRNLNKNEGKQKPDKKNEAVLRNDVTETDVERSFKEGLANNSDTEKIDRLQK